jgi:hypothetical protein
MRKSLTRGALAFLLAASVSAAVLTVQVRTAPVAKAATCDAAAWYTVEGPVDSPLYNGARVRAWLYATKDIYNGQFCGLVHSSIDWSQEYGKCNTFYTAVWTNELFLWTNVTKVVSCSPSGSVQSPFYRSHESSPYFMGGGWITSYDTARAVTPVYWT